MVSGRYSQHFRTGGQKNTAVEIIHKSLNSARGSAYQAYDDQDNDTIVSMKNLAYAKAINEIHDSNIRLSNQWNPDKMLDFIPRWEKILGIIPNPNDSLERRKEIIAAKMTRWTQPANNQGVLDLIEVVLDDIFIELEHVDPNTNPGIIPGGGTIPGGASLGNGNWSAPCAAISVRVWRKRDKEGNYFITYGEMIQKVQRLISMLNDYLPVWTEIGWYHYFENPEILNPGTISIAAGSTTVVGTGTTFSQYFNSGIKFEVIDEEGLPISFTVDSINSNTEMTVESSHDVAVSGSKYRLAIFILDHTNNLNNSILVSA